MTVDNDLPAHDQRWRVREQPARHDIEEVVYRGIRRVILSGRLPPGTKLGEEELAAIYFTSRSRIRTVLQRLGHDFLVDLQRNRGAFVASPTPADTREVFSARRMVERVTTEITTRTAMTHQLRELADHLRRQQQAMAAGARHAAILQSGEFHARIARLAGNRLLAHLLDQLISRTALILAVLGTPSALAQGLRDQTAVLALMEQGDSGGAARAVERALFALEAALDARWHAARRIDLGTVLGQVGHDDVWWGDR